MKMPCNSNSCVVTLASLIRNFMFLGFKVLPAGHRFVPNASGSVVYMAYSIDDPCEEDSD